MLNHPPAEVSQRGQRDIPLGGDVVAPTLQTQSISQQKQPLLHVASKKREQARESRRNEAKPGHRDGSGQRVERDIRYWVSPFTSDPWGEHGHPEVELKAPPPPPGYDSQPHTLHEPGAMVVGCASTSSGNCGMLQ